MILSIETSTARCSASLSENGKTVLSRKTDEDRAHAAMLAKLIDDILKEQKISSKELQAVAVSEGPGSYTGLRVGVSTAKGICYGAGLPLLAVDTLAILAKEAMEKKACDENTLIVPMIDARRMEVYTARFDGTGKKLSDTEALVLDENSFSDVDSRYSRIIFIGDGAAKFREVYKKSNAVFIETEPDAAYMSELADSEFKASRFQDIAYFEPRYLKEFVAGISKKKII